MKKFKRLVQKSNPNMVKMLKQNWTKKRILKLKKIFNQTEEDKIIGTKYA